MKRMRNLAWLVFGLGTVITVPGLCRAQAKCPWLNAATATGVLGGEVELSVSSAPDVPSTPSQYRAADQRADRFDVTCDFRRKVGDNVYQLQIAVNTLVNPPSDFQTYLARCPSKILLRAIGNEAYQCQVATDGKTADPFKEQVMGRVRNRAFVLTINRNPELLVQPISAGLSDETRNIAEQVAGSLF